MVYKNNEIKNYKIQYRKLIFSLVLIIYFTGICAGCAFAFKNGQNLAFVKKVTMVENISKVDKTAFLACSVRCCLRDCIMLLSVLVLKHAGILKGMCIIIPFVNAVQNSAIYATAIYEKQISFFNLIFQYILKDTAVIFILILYTCIVINEIISGKSDVKRDIKKLFIYSVAVLIIYIIDITVKSMVYPF